MYKLELIRTQVNHAVGVQGQAERHVTVLHGRHVKGVALALGWGELRDAGYQPEPGQFVKGVHPCKTSAIIMNSTLVLKQIDCYDI